MTTMLSIAHFVFMARAGKDSRCHPLGAHTLGWRKYHGYAALLDAMEGRADGFWMPKASVMKSPSSLVALGLMRWQD